MTDNPAYRLSLRIDAARAAADVSTDPAVHSVKNALEGVQAAAIYRLEREAHELLYPLSSRTDDLPKWSSVCPEGQTEQPGTFIGPIDTSALRSL